MVTRLGLLLARGRPVVMSAMVQNILSTCDRIYGKWSHSSHVKVSHYTTVDSRVSTGHTFIIACEDDTSEPQDP